MLPASRVRAVALATVVASLGLFLPAALPSATAATVWTATATVSPTSAARGTQVTFTVKVTSPTTSSALVDLEVYSAAGVRSVAQVWDNQAFTAGVTRTFTFPWTVPTGETLNAHSVKVGIFTPGWGTLFLWNDTAGSLTVTAAAPPTTTTTTTVAPTTTTTAAPGAPWTGTASVSPTAIYRGTSVTFTVKVTSNTTRSALVDLEVYSASQARTFAQVWDNQSFTAGTTRTFTFAWTVPAGEALDAHSVKVGVFTPGWGTLFLWNGAAASFTVTTPATTTTTTRPPTTTSSTTAPPPPTGHFVTLPPGSALPSDAQCAAAVRHAPEVRPLNAGANSYRWTGTSATYPRATGSFHGTTDEILQWNACKWGIDEDVVRAQVAKESWWKQSVLGDWTTNAGVCAPNHGIGADGRAGQCPESVGLMQVRTQYYRDAIDGSLASSSYNVDIGYAVWRGCYEGQFTWLGAGYAKGDMWGCVGMWFSGRWHTPEAETYIAAVKDWLGQRIWTTPGFLADTGP